MTFNDGYRSVFELARPDPASVDALAYPFGAAVTAAELAHRIAYAWPR
jgi:hypothetical protein